MTPLPAPCGHCGGPDAAGPVRAKINAHNILQQTAQVPRGAKPHSTAAARGINHLVRQQSWWPWESLSNSWSCVSCQLNLIAWCCCWQPTWLAMSCCCTSDSCTSTTCASARCSCSLWLSSDNCCRPAWWECDNVRPARQCTNSMWHQSVHQHDTNAIDESTSSLTAVAPRSTQQYCTGAQSFLSNCRHNTLANLEVPAHPGQPRPAGC